MVCLAFIVKYGQETAQAFVDFHVADEGKIWKKYQEARTKAGIPMDPHEVTHVEERTTQRSKLIQDYGVDKNASYGWASAALGRKNSNLHELAEDVNLGGFFPYYQVAHILIHASPTAIIERKIGSSLLDTLTTVGPHQEGLTEPIYLVLASLEDFMKVLLSLRVNETTVLKLTVVDRLVDETIGILGLK